MTPVKFYRCTDCEHMVNDMDEDSFECEQCGNDIMDIYICVLCNDHNTEETVSQIIANIKE